MIQGVYASPVTAVLAALLIAVAAPGAPAAAAGPAPLELSAAWGGVSRPGRMTELRVRLSSPAAGTVLLRIASAGAVIESALAVRRAEWQEVTVPVPASETVAVRAQFPDGTSAAGSLPLRLAEEPLLAVAATSLRPAAVSGAATGRTARVEVNAGELPRQHQAYQAVDAVLVDAGALAQLDTGQLQGLVDYLGRCGALVAIALPQAASDLLRKEAGCGGRTLMLLADDASTDAAVLSVLAAAPAEPVGRALLRPLLPQAAGPWPLVVAAVLAYFALAAVLLAFAGRPAVLVTCASLATLAVLVGPHVVQPKPRLSIWAESESQDHRGRYSALAETTGAGRGTRTQVLPELLQGAGPCAVADADSDDATGSADSTPPPHWRWDPAHSRFLTVTFEQRLFATAAVCWHGGFPLTRSASTRRLGSGGILVTNRGAGIWPAGVAVQDGRRYVLPVVPPGTARVLSASAQVPESPATDLAAMSGDGDSAVLLWPLELSARGVEHLPARAFLALRAAHDMGGS
ncbi:MAG: hypothetical protein JSR67_11180 [Proteobacteria bacterium]|nr:hypothetical protein [Pseudomonadota bacterium]